MAHVSTMNKTEKNDWSQIDSEVAFFWSYSNHQKFCFETIAILLLPEVKGMGPNEI